jgi:hypothetical protein
MQGKRVNWEGREAKRKEREGGVWEAEAGGWESNEGEGKRMFFFLALNHLLSFLALICTSLRGFAISGLIFAITVRLRPVFHR